MPASIDPGVNQQASLKFLARGERTMDTKRISKAVYEERDFFDDRFREAMLRTGWVGSRIVYVLQAHYSASLCEVDTPMTDTQSDLQHFISRFMPTFNLRYSIKQYCSQ